MCGFADQMYFSKVFKESMGVSPKEYIARGKER
jgi:AraC-like DNA-binding protein